MQDSLRIRLPVSRVTLVPGAVGVVTGITRDGLVKMFKPAGHIDEPDWRGRPDRGQQLPSVGFVQAIIGSAARIDVPGALATAACRTWDTTVSVRPYDTLDEVRAALRPHFRTQPAGEPLHEAAETRAAAVRAAWDSYRHARDSAFAAGSGDPAGHEQRERARRAAWDAYTQRSAEANQAYLSAYARATAATPQAAAGDRRRQQAPRPVPAALAAKAAAAQDPEPGR